MIIKYKQLIAPFVAVIFILMQTIFGISISEEIQSQVVDVLVNFVAVGFVIYGIVKNNIDEKK